MFRRALFLVLPLVIVACGGASNPSLFDDPQPGADSGASGADTNAPGGDSSTPAEDGSVAADSALPPPIDSGTEPLKDTGFPFPVDTGSVVDTGFPFPFDTGVPPIDTGVGAKCTEPGGKVYAGHCYYPINTARSWSQQRDACAAAGAHLVTITSAGEQTVAGSFGGGDRWIGLAWFSGGSDFDWLTSEPVSYDNWLAGEPNGSGYCARMRLDSGNQWADQGCSQSYGAVCERE